MASFRRLRQKRRMEWDATWRLPASWPVKSRLKEVIDYAENPDKTIDKRYVDSGLCAALQNVSNDKKADQRMYVSGNQLQRQASL